MRKFSVKKHTFLSSEIFKAFFQCNWFGGSLKVEKKLVVQPLTQV